jgi:hypothetical protein
MQDDLIAVTDAAALLGKQKQYVFKIINRLKIEKWLHKSSTARGQKVAYVTQKDFELIRKHANPSNNILDEARNNQLHGVFYLIQLEPQLDPNRFKLGFATSIEERLRAHRTSAPFADVLKIWPCKLLWEKTAIECVSQGCEKIYTEVFIGDIETVRKKCDAFFALMPVLEDEF